MSTGHGQEIQDARAGNTPDISGNKIFSSLYSTVLTLLHAGISLLSTPGPDISIISLPITYRFP